MTSCRILALNVVAEREFGDDENVVDFGVQVYDGKDTFGGAVVVEKVWAHSSTWTKRSKVRVVEKRGDREKVVTVRLGTE